MSSTVRQLRWSLWAGVAYFALVALAHGAQVKLPVLFIYFDVPSHAYQDRIIGLLAFGWSAFFATAARDPQAARPLIAAILVAGAAAVIGLAGINATTDFGNLTGLPRVWPYWTAFAAALAYWLWIFRLLLRLGKG